MNRRNTFRSSSSKDSWRNSVQLSHEEVKDLNLTFIRDVITKACNCSHKTSGTNMYLFEKTGGVISIHFCMTGCIGYGIIYLNRNGIPIDIKSIQECDDLEISEENISI